MGNYADFFARSIDDPEGFWGDAAAAVDWSSQWDTVVDRSNPPFYRWFAGATLNACHNALDRHVDAGNGDRHALIYDSPVTGTVKHYTYSELRDEVARLAGALQGLGVETGDRVLIYMPMVPQAAMAMLACARIGAIHSVVFGGFAPAELATRINDAKPRVILSASCGIEGSRVIAYKPLLDEAIDLSEHKPSSCVIMARPQAEAALQDGRDHDWETLVGGSAPAPCVPVPADHPLYILYTSGTTGQPKGIVRDTGGHAVALTWSMKYFYDCAPGSVFWAASDVGWVVGHSYIVYAPLFYGATTVIYEGKPVGTPDPGAFWRVISEHNVSSLFTAPTALRAIKREDPEGEHLQRYDMSRFKALFLAGERSDPDTIRWAETLLNVPVVDHWWQTETGWAIAGNPLGIEAFAIKPGSATKPVPGWNLQVLDGAGEQVQPGDIGALVVKLPLPPGAMLTLWQAPERFKSAYMTQFDGYYMTGDAGFIDDDGYVHVMTRVDDVINVAGHRLSTGAMEEVLCSHPDVAEAAVIGAHDELKGQLPLGFVVLKAGVARPHEVVVKDLVSLVREKIGAVAAFKTATVVERLPKTRSGKILRGTMKKIADSETYKTPPTIDDPVILEEIEVALREIGYAGGQ